MDTMQVIEKVDPGEWTRETDDPRIVFFHHDHPMLYHVTSRDNAERILAEGFRSDCPEAWLANRQLDANEGVYGDTVLRVEFSVPLHRLQEFEVTEAEKPYREWIVPAAFIAANAIVKAC